MKKYDIAIVGGGIVGLSLACALAKLTPLSILLLESKPINPYDPSLPHPRVSAITLTSEKIFQKLGVWEKLHITPFHKIYVWDNEEKLSFNAQDIGQLALGYIIENDLIVHQLYGRLKQFSSIDFVVEQLTDLTKYPAKLVIAADGANSWVRAQTDIQVTRQDYQQSAIVCNVKTELPHENIARQVFLTSGPLAFLPLSEPNLCSIVWSSDTEIEDNFIEKLSAAFPYLGKILEADKRFVFPLACQKTSSYIFDNIALVGDAAHTVHPLAGQGVNMGLLDAACLVDVILNAIANKRNFASYSTLRRYERWRKADNLSLFCGIDLIKKCFANQSVVFGGIRSVGLSITEQMPRLKNLFARHAIGERQNLPGWIVDQ